MQLTTVGFSLLAALGVWTLGVHEPPSRAAPAAASAPLAQNPNGNQFFTLHSLRGRHGFSYDGTVQGLGPVASSGRIDFDGNGHLSADYSTSVNGTTFTGSFTGTYTVAGNGTGTVTLDLALLGLQAHGSFVLVDRGNGTFFTSTDAGFSVAGRTIEM